VVAVVTHALWSFGKTAIRTPLLGTIGALALAARLVGHLGEIPVLLGAGLLTLLATLAPSR
jgi:hypothetical protein